MAIGIGIGVPFMRGVGAVTTVILNDGDAVPVTLGTWRWYIDGNNDVLVQNRFVGVWTTVDVENCINPLGDWQWEIDAVTNDLTLQFDNGMWVDMTTYYSNGGDAWRLTVIGGDLYLQESIAGTWTNNTKWNKIT